MSDSTLTFLVLAAVVVAFVSNRIPVAIVAVGTALSLWATGVLELSEATAGFGDPTVLFIASLFVVSEALDSTGVTAWVGQLVIDRAGRGRARVVIAVSVLCALLTAFITPNASVAALVPVTVIVARRVGQPTSQLMIPLAFAAHAGALLALTGSPISVVISDLAADEGIGRFGFFEFALVGIPLVAATVAVVLLLGPRLLPQRTPDSQPPDLTEHGRRLASHYRIDGEDGSRLVSRRYGAAELIVPPRSPLVGARVEAGSSIEGGELVVVAMMRGDERLDGPDVELAAGDTLLVRGTWQALSAEIDADPTVLAVDPPDLIRRQAIPLGLGSIEAIVVLAAMVALLVTDAVPAAVAGLLAAGALVLLGVVSVERVWTSIGWTTVVLVAGMIPLSTAMRTSGAADTIADRVVDLVGDAGPYPLLIALFLITAAFGQLISSMATALIVIPIGLAAAAELDIAVAPVLMSINVAAHAALLTPIATPPNLMVMDPGGYRFGDYWKLGLPVLVLYFVASVLLVPLIWQF